MNLPKELAAEGIEADVRAVLANEVVELYRGSPIRVPVLKLNPELRRHIFIAKAVSELIIGYEAIEAFLANELKGLKNVDNKSDRVSRLLLVSNDGSPRFYRELEFLRSKHGERVLICRLDINSGTMLEILGVKAQMVKAILVNRKKSLVNVLRSLLYKA